MSISGADLLTLQGNIKRDPDGYADEFRLQYQHYKAGLAIFNLKPSKDSKDFGELVMFIAQVAKCYPKEAASFGGELMALLDAHAGVLDAGLRKTLVQALTLLQHRGLVEAVPVLQLFFRLLRCQDRPLRSMVFKHIVSHIRAANKRTRNERLNRALQNFLYSVMQDDNEAAAKKSLAVVTEMWRRHVWRDARTINVIASAASHKSSRVMLAAVKFFLGQDRSGEEGSEDEGEEEAQAAKRKGPSKEDVYKAYHAGTSRSKKKKQKKLQRVMATVKKAVRRQGDNHSESFAAIHLLHDPQSFVERLFGRLQGSHEAFESRLAMLSLISRVTGTHKLLLLNLYPYLQKYLLPHQKEVTVVLAALIQATHELVPPDALAPVMRQLVDNFVSDRSRPEVMTVGLKAVREVCVRCPLVMGEDMLQDLAGYKKFRDKEVSAAARSLIGLFRDLAPSLLAKKDRGRGADLEAAPRQYGEVQVLERVAGAELLQAALERGDNLDSSDEEEELDSSDEDDDGAAGSGGEEEEEEEGGSEEGSEELEDDSEEAGSSGQEEEEAEEEASGSGSGGEEDEEEEEEQPVNGKSRSAGRKAAAARAAARKQLADADSLATLKKQLAAAKAAKAAAAAPPAPAAPAVNIEMDRILTEEDFERIRRLKHKQLIQAAMSKHGLKSVKRNRKLLEAAEAEVDELEALQDSLRSATERRVDPSDLLGKRKREHDKASRMATVMAGREGREAYGASSSHKKQKTGGLSEAEKKKRKHMPLMGRISQLKNLSKLRKNKNHPKDFKGKQR